MGAGAVSGEPGKLKPLSAAAQPPRGLRDPLDGRRPELELSLKVSPPESSGGRLPWLVLSVWAVAAVVATYIRPGELLEFALIGCAGLCAWDLIGSCEGRRHKLTAVLLFFVPLLNTWPVRTTYAHIEGLGAAAYLLAPSSLVAVLAFAFVTRFGRRGSRTAALPLALCAVAVAAAIVSSIASRDPAAAAAAAWLALIAPIGVAAAVARAARTTPQGWVIVAAPALASLVPAAMGIAAYMISFGLPLSLDELREGKGLMHRTGLVQEITFGNVAHLATFALLMLPSAVTASLSKALPRMARVGAAASAFALLAALALVYSRAAVIMLAGVLLVAALMIAWRFSERKHRFAVLILALSVAATAPVVAALGWSSLVSSDGASGGQIQADTSVHVRVDAIRAGLQIFDGHRLGVGSEQYPVYDPVHTAPHSLLVRLLAENGVLGGAAFVLILACIGTAGRSLTTGLSNDEWLLRIGCFLGTSGFLAYGLVAGAPLAIGPVAVWSLLLGAQLGILLSQREVNP